MARAKAAPKPKGPGRGNRTKAPRGRAGAPVPKSAPKHNRTVVHPTRPKSPRHDPSGGHLPEEMVGGFKCKHCGWPGWREHRVVTKEGSHHATLAFAGCTNCGTLHAAHVGIAAHANAHNQKVHAKVNSRVRKMSELTTGELDVLKTHGTLQEDLDVAKSVDSTETAVQRDDAGSGAVGHRNACPRGGDGPCGPDKAGRCGWCDWRVEDHQALGKTTGLNAVVLDLRKLAGLA